MKNTIGLQHKETQSLLADLMAVMANIIGALLIPILPLSMVLLMTQPIIHPVKSMRGTTGVIKCSILDEPEIKPGQGVSQAHLNYL